MTYDSFRISARPVAERRSEHPSSHVESMAYRDDRTRFRTWSVPIPPLSRPLLTPIRRIFDCYPDRSAPCVLVLKQWGAVSNHFSGKGFRGTRCAEGTPRKQGGRYLEARPTAGGSRCPLTAGRGWLPRATRWNAGTLCAGCQGMSARLKGLQGSWGCGSISQHPGLEFWSCIHCRQPCSRHSPLSAIGLTRGSSSEPQLDRLK
jgi:hypothetical protein